MKGIKSIMKKILITAALIAAMAAMAGCADKNTESGNNTSKTMQSEQVTEQPVTKAAVSQKPAQKTEPSIITASAVSSVDGGMSEADVYKGDIDGDGKEDVVTIYTSAEVIDGVPELEDRNSWLIEVDMGGEHKVYYPLFGGVVYNDEVEIEVVKKDSKTVILTDIADAVEDKHYAFEPTAEGFKKTEVSDDAYDSWQKIYETEYYDD